MHHQTSTLAKVPEFVHILPSTQGIESKLIYVLWAAVSQIRGDFQSCHIWARNLAIGQSSRSCTYTLVLAQVSKFGLFSLHEQRCSRYGPTCIFKIAIFGHENWPLAKVPEVAHILLKLPSSAKFHSVLFYGGWPFPRCWQFCLFPLGTISMLNFNLFFTKFENSYQQVLWGLSRVIFRKTLLAKESELQE